jgi:PAS domain S-box-containing protein
MSAEFGLSESVIAEHLEFAPDATVGVDESGRIEFANAKATEMFGYGREDLLGMQLEILIPLPLRAEHPQHRARYFRERGARQMGAGLRVRGVRSDGSEFDAEISLSSVDAAHGPIAFAAVRDISHRARDREMFEQLLELAPDAIVGVDRDGQIVLANAQMESLFGYKRADLLGRPLETLVPERLRQGHAAHRAQFMREPRTRPMGSGLELYGLRADGTEFPAEISLSSIQTEDGTIATAAIRDISDRLLYESARKKLEAELRLNQSRRMESLGQLAGGVAHDFNNLLSVIVNYAQFAADELDEQPSVREDVKQIQAAARRAADLTRQLLIFGRRDVAKPEPVDLNEVLVDLERILNRTLGEQIELRTQFEPELWTVIADPGQIEQVVVNLAVNSRDAMPDGGLLEIETANVVLDEAAVGFDPDALKPGRHVCIVVADSGVGMDRETAERAFEPFFTTKQAGDGTGLGLATVHGIVKQSGGSIRLYSEPGYGTTIKMYLPAVDVPAASTHEEPKTGPQGRGERIAVVEDESAVRTMAQRILTGSGYDVTAFAGSAEALAAIGDSDQRFDLMLTDVVMPELSGRELAVKVRELRPTLKVVFMSGYSEAMIGRVGAEDAIAPLLTKPFTTGELLEAIRHALDAGD